MGNLVPEKRRDRNGRLVTRYVRAAGGPSVPAIPALAPPSPPADEIPYDVAALALDIRDGLISLDDVHAIGVERFSRGDFVWYMRGALRNLGAGQAAASTEQIAYALDLAAAEDFDIGEVRDLGLILLSTDVSGLPEGTPLRRVVNYYARLRDGWVRADHTRSTSAEEAEAAVYCARLGLPEVTNLDRIARDFYDAGIPIAVARQVISAGGAVEVARAIHEGGIEPGLATGYL